MFVNVREKDTNILEVFYCKKRSVSIALIPPCSATNKDHFCNEYEATHKLLVIPHSCTA